MNQWLGSSVLARTDTCFHESDASSPLLRRSLAEGVGTLLLMFVICTVGPQLLAIEPREPGLRFLTNAVAGATALIGLIVTFGSLSGGHFNPLITMLQCLFRERTARCTLAYVVAQISGALVGARLASAILGMDPAPAPAGRVWTLLPGEALATAGLLVVVFGCARSGRTDTGPFAVGSWLLAIAVAVPKAFLNPALTVAALLASPPVVLSGSDVLCYLPSQLVGALIAFVTLRATYSKVPAVNLPAAKRRYHDSAEP